MNDKLNKRHGELSEMLFNIGVGLSKEGTSKEDFRIASISDMLMLISTLIIEDNEDILLFSQLCSMFTAKKVLDSSSTKTLLNGFNNEEFLDILKDSRDNLLNDKFNLEDDNEDEDDEDVNNK